MRDLNHWADIALAHYQDEHPDIEIQMEWLDEAVAARVAYDACTTLAAKQEVGLRYVEFSSRLPQELFELVFRGGGVEVG